MAVSRPAIVGSGDARGRDRAGHGLDRGDELVALPVDRADDRLPVAVVVDGLANRLDAGGECRLADEAITPDLVEQLLLADDGAAALHQVREDVEGLRLELDLLTVAAQDDAGQIQLAVREPQDHVYLAVDSTRSRFAGPTIVTPAGLTLAIA